MKFCALGLTIMARIQGSLKRSPTRTTLGPFGLGGTTDGRSSLRLTATVVSAGRRRGGRGARRSQETHRHGVRAVASAAAHRRGACGIGSLFVRSVSGHGVRLAVGAGSAAVATAAGRRGAARRGKRSLPAHRTGSVLGSPCQ